MKKWLFVLISAVAGLILAGFGAWIGILLISGKSPEISSAIGPTILGPVFGAWFGARLWTDRQTIARRAAESMKQNEND